MIVTNGKDRAVEMANQSNNTNNTTFQNAVLSDWVYGSVNTAPPGFVTLKVYSPATTDAQVVLVGKLDPTGQTITQLDLVTRGTRFSELDSNSAQDLKSDTNIIAGNANDQFVTGIGQIAGEISADLTNHAFSGISYGGYVVGQNATIQGNTGQSLGGFGADLLQALLSQYNINVPTQTFAAMNGDQVIGEVVPNWNIAEANAQNIYAPNDPLAWIIHQADARTSGAWR